MDAWSAGISCEAISAKLNEKWIAVDATVVGIITAIIYLIGNITGFLYLIGSIFAPMIAVQISDSFILKRDNITKAFDIVNLVIWFIGFILYRILMNMDFIFDNTIPDMIITIIICVVVHKIIKD